jgi:tRNA modification GTPase
MIAQASVLTAKGTGAISCIQLTGRGGRKIIDRIFTPSSNRSPQLSVGSFVTGNLHDGGRVIDHVLLGCEGEGDFAINCHGNPIIVEMIMNLLQTHGAKPVVAEDILSAKFANESDNTIHVEAKLAQLKAVTFEGVKIIASQSNCGLAKLAKEWLDNIDTISLPQLQQDCREILDRTETARLLIKGCTVVITGPANSGKSTLLNCLSGRQKAIVADVAGTTRDWVSAKCKIDPLLVEFLDTAGLDKVVAEKSQIERNAQKITREMIEKSDAVLYVTDSTKKSAPSQLNWIKNKKVLLLQNKCDLLNNRQKAKLPAGSLAISAKNTEGIDNLCQQLGELLKVKNFDQNAVVCFTDRQIALVTGLLQVKKTVEAKSLITELLTGRSCV